MKLVPLSLAALFLVGGMGASLRADEPKPATPATTIQGKWNVRVEVLMVALPEEKALALLPDLLDDAKIDAACAQIMEAIKRKEATLTGNPIVQALDGQAGRSETNLEKIYPTQFEPPNRPVNFEKRNVGPLLETRCLVSPGGDFIQVELAAQRTELLGNDAYEAGVTVNDVPLKIEQPRFFTSKVSNNLAARNGQRTLIGVHKLTAPAGNMEFFILRATATPAH